MHYLLFQHEDGWVKDDKKKSDPTDYHANVPYKSQSWEVEDSNPEILYDSKQDGGVIKGGPLVDVSATGTFSVKNCSMVDEDDETITCPSFQPIAKTIIPKDHTKNGGYDHSPLGSVVYYLDPK